MAGALKPCLRKALPLTLIGASFAPAFAQTDPDSGDHQQSSEVPTPDDGTLVIDLKAEAEGRERDPVLEERCEEFSDAAQVANEIVVCRDLGETTDGSWNQQDFIRRYAEATQGPKPVNVDGTGLYLGLPPIVEIKGCFIPPCPPPPALIIDVTALPEAPPGSDADRIARGLPPLGPSGDGGRDISEEELGLPPRPAELAADE